MSVKHVQKEFLKICNDYHEMVETLHELEQELADKVISEETYNRMIAPVEQMKANYLRWSYMIYLLNLPNKKEKQKRYKKQFVDMQNADLAENEELLNKLKQSEAAV